MKGVDLKELGRVIRNRRLELGLKQSDLADQFISPSTISILERGESPVSNKKLEYLCKKLELDVEEIPRLIEAQREKERDRTEEILFELETIENDIDFVGPQFALDRLRQVEVSSDSPLQAHIKFLKGKIYYRKGKSDKAETYLEQCIQLYDGHPSIHKSNLKAASYYILGQMSFKVNAYHEALDYVNAGLDAFLENGDRAYVKYNLLIAKVIYLEKLERFGEGIHILNEEMWPNLSEIDTDIQLNMYEMHATLLNKQNMPEKAIPYARKGIDLARRSRNHDRCFELWTTLGSSYKQIGDLKKARLCLETALRFKDDVKNPDLPAYNYTELGILNILEGNTELAEKNLRKATKLGKKARDAAREFDALFALGGLCYGQNKIDEAIKFLLEAKKIAEENLLLRQERDAITYLIVFDKEKKTINFQEYFARLHQISLQLINGGDDKMAQNIHAHVFLHKSAGDPPDI